MTKKYLKLSPPKLALLALISLILIIVPVQVMAQEPTPESPDLASSDRLITFRDLGEGNLVLRGELGQSREVNFRLPTDWQPGAGSTLEMFLSYISLDADGVAAGDGGGATIPAILTVSLNGVDVSVVDVTDAPLNERFLVDLPPLAWSRVVPGEEHSLRFRLLASGGTCGDIAEVTISEESALTLAASEYTVPGYDLEQYPRLLISDTLLETQTLFVLPEAASPQELASASAIATRLGLFGQNSSALFATTDTAFEESLDGNSHLIIVGTFENNGLVADIAGAQAEAISSGIGLIQLGASPFNENRAALVVAGVDAEGVTLAASALSRDIQFPVLAESQVIVTEVIEPPAPEPTSGATTLSQLGYTSEQRSGDNVETLAYMFDMSGGFRVEEGSYIDLQFAHAEPLADGSSITLFLNGLPIASTPLTEENSSDGQFTASVPAGLELWRHDNLLRVRAEMLMVGDCRQPTSGSFPWVTVFDNSSFEITGRPGSSRRFTLGDFPQPFLGQGNLGELEFILPETPSIEVLTVLVQLSADLASSGSSDLLLPLVSLGTSNANVSSEYKVVIGTPSSNPHLASLNDELHQPLDAETNAVDQARNRVQYVIPPNQSVGLIQLLVPSTEIDSVTLVITGTDEPGVFSAGRALTGFPGLEGGVGGNLVFVEDLRVNSFDVGAVIVDETPQAPVEGEVAEGGVEGEPAIVEPGAEATEVPDAPSSPSLMLLGILAILLVAVGLIVVITRWRASRGG